MKPTEFKIGDTVRVLKKPTFNVDENTLVYVLAGEFPPSCIDEYDFVIIKTQEDLDKLGGI